MSHLRSVVIMKHEKHRLLSVNKVDATERETKKKKIPSVSYGFVLVTLNKTESQTIK